MNRTKKLLSAMIAVLMIAGCSSRDPQPEEPAADTETPESPGETASSIRFCDPSVFEGFDHFTTLSGDTEITIGDSAFSALGDLPVVHVTQFQGLGQTGKTDPETLDPGALGRILIDSFAKSGLPVMIRIYNPYDTPAAPADCLIIGVENNDGIIFSNGIRYDSGLEEYTALLGEPSGISGEVYFWCDENQAHIVNVQVKNGETSLLSYMNLTAVQKQLP